MRPIRDKWDVLYGIAGAVVLTGLILHILALTFILYIKIYSFLHGL